ncbi:glycogen/starch/alpha-glucan phosphorylase [Albimonas sp. CAU 1670]|uniref:glycogen/starch/alpha-glucan phosphorylase n=1 Tax=Albimonas sp. CAU 1670 TaxID=3032599 RepID=UPI0023DA425C|nr:glycogen/starch/alpha-glucan phosphorylase [Albimonas sp. CAU 1670]MDF2231969.1 glycogen/starch/alpha-glucan phosphorylase [Albimonas sp. CAU 1670]
MNFRHAVSRPTDADELADAVLNHLTFTIGKTTDTATLSDWRLALTHAIRDMVVAPWFDSVRQVYKEDRKRVYYLSMEFLIGRLLEDAIDNLGLGEMARKAVEKHGIDWREVLDDEPDAALGNGGLGRLAACFLDSMSTVGLPAHGYGIRYDHGLFRQGFHEGWQVEEAEEWLRQAHPWEFQRREVQHRIGFGGSVRQGEGDAAEWEPEEVVIAAAYDTPVPGWGGRWTNTLRLWSAKPERLFELDRFNRGDFVGAAAPAILAQTISRVLYPDDTTPQGKELRLKQEYFFTAASVRDLLRRFVSDHQDVRELPNKVAIQLNDTHPAIAVAELVRLLIDRHGLSFDEAFEVSRGTLHYTNHTLMPEALERWSWDLMSRVLPRHLQIIEKINRRHEQEFPDRPEATRIIDHGEIRMGNLAFVGSCKVNGVSALHTDLMKKTVFKDLHELHPDRIVNVTNGVTPRRWINTCNGRLRDLLNETVGEGWITDLDKLERIRPHATQRSFQDALWDAKRINKAALSNWLLEHTGVGVDPDAMFDVQIKRIHEYKRQLLNILEAAALYNEMRDNPGKDWTPRVKLFGGKAAPGYQQAKLIIKLINDIGRKINEDPAIGDRLKIVFPPNYNVSMAERLIPASDLSEQISTAGMEASGTGNMKLSMNGALTVGTLDGANVEIREAVGPENIFIFGKTADEVHAMRERGYDSRPAIEADERLARVITQIERGVFSPDDPGRFRGIADTLRHHDWFMVTADFSSYWTVQRRIDDAWKDRRDWLRKSAINIAGMGRFSSDRSIKNYADYVWEAEYGF